MPTAAVPPKAIKAGIWDSFIISVMLISWAPIAFPIPKRVNSAPTVPVVAAADKPAILPILPTIVFGIWYLPPNGFVACTAVVRAISPNIAGPSAITCLVTSLHSM